MHIVQESQGMKGLIVKSTSPFQIYLPATGFSSPESKTLTNFFNFLLQICFAYTSFWYMHTSVHVRSLNWLLIKKVIHEHYFLIQIKTIKARLRRLLSNSPIPIFSQMLPLWVIQHPHNINTTNMFLCTYYKYMYLQKICSIILFLN